MIEPGESNFIAKAIKSMIGPIKINPGIVTKISNEYFKNNSMEGDAGLVFSQASQALSSQCDSVLSVHQTQTFQRKR